MKIIMDNNLKPTYGSSFRHGWQTMFKYFLVLLLIVVITFMVVSPMFMGNGGVNFEVDSDKWIHEDQWENVHISIDSADMTAIGIFALLGFIATAYFFLVVPVFTYGASLIFLQAVRDTKPEFDNLIKGFRHHYLYIVLANLLTVALVMLGFILLFIPGIIVACRLVFVPYLVMDKNLDPILAVEESWKLTRGHGWKIFLMGVTSFFIIVLSPILLFVGIFPAFMWVQSSFASLYEAVNRQKVLEPAGA